MYYIKELNVCLAHKLKSLLKVCHVQGMYSNSELISLKI